VRDFFRKIGAAIASGQSLLQTTMIVRRMV
jgi:hypothetical protein